MIMSSTPSAIRNSFLFSSVSRLLHSASKTFSTVSASSSFSGSFFLYCATALSRSSTPFFSPNFSWFFALDCRRMARISLAYCLLLSNSCFCRRWTSHSIKFVLCPNLSAMSSLISTRFSTVESTWNTAMASSATFSSNRSRLSARCSTPPASHTASTIFCVFSPDSSRTSSLVSSSITSTASAATSAFSCASKATRLLTSCRRTNSAPCSGTPASPFSLTISSCSSSSDSMYASGSSACLLRASMFALRFFSNAL
mmetsp:Transcript_3782/g.23882  ORF Transcript_3782/g.23882 Transcript_3782/m.23882 type:complete len:256 (+) Transcript_3782:3428-4195(+)